MSRLFVFAAACALAGCGPSQAEVSAASVYYCEQQRLDAVLAEQGESPGLRYEIRQVSDNLINTVEGSSDPEGVWEALKNDTECL